MEKQTGRLEAFSDGIFGVAITLLALDIGVKEYDGMTNLGLWHELLRHWPEYFTYFNSFAVVLLIWLGHHRILKPVRVADTTAMFLNGLVLLLVALFPFPTKTVGRFIGTNAVGTAAAFYAGFTCLINFALMLLTVYVRRHKKLLVDETRSVATLSTLLRHEGVGVASYAALAAVALPFPKVALAGTFVMWVFWAVVVARAEEAMA